MSEDEFKLHRAAIRGDVETLSKLLSDGMSTETQDKNGNTPLHLCGHPSIITCLIVNGCNLFARNNNNDLAIDIMRRKGINAAVINYLNEEMVMFAEDRGVFQRMKNFLMFEVYRDFGPYRFAMTLLVFGIISFYVATYVSTYSHRVQIPVNQMNANDEL